MVVERSQSPPSPQTNKRVMSWTHPLSYFFAMEPGEVACVVNTDQHSVIFERQRALFILLRIRLMATLFAGLTPLWIPVDILTFPPAVWHHIALLRMGATAAFAALAWYTVRAATLKQGYLALTVLFALPLVFYLLSHAVLFGVPLSPIGTIIASSYAFLPFVLVAGISIFPLTVKESAALMLPLLAITAIPLITRHAFMMPNFEGVAVLWLLALVAAVGSLSAVSHLQLMHTQFAQTH